MNKRKTDKRKRHRVTVTIVKEITKEVWASNDREAFKTVREDIISKNIKITHKDFDKYPIIVKE
jgi:hypothetical protein